MTIGQRILEARQEAGMSQRELAGGDMTRNMLSALEHDAAQPSIATLKLLAQRLNKPVSYLLGEPTAEECSPIPPARQDFAQGNYAPCLQALERETAPEAVLLKLLSHLALAQQAVDAEEFAKAREHLAQADSLDCLYRTPELERRMAILRAKCPEAPQQLPDLVAAIGSDDEVCLLRAQAAMAQQEPQKALEWLERMEKATFQRSRLQGEALFALGSYQQAAQAFHAIETQINVNRQLEECYVQLEDFRKAYYYAKAAQKG